MGMNCTNRSRVNRNSLTISLTDPNTQWESVDQLRRNCQATYFSSAPSVGGFVSRQPSSIHNQCPQVPSSAWPSFLEMIQEIENRDPNAQWKQGSIARLRLYHQAVSFGSNPPQPTYGLSHSRPMYRNQPQQSYGAASTSNPMAQTNNSAATIPFAPRHELKKLTPFQRLSHAAQLMNFPEVPAFHVVVSDSFFLKDLYLPAVVQLSDFAFEIFIRDCPEAMGVLNTNIYLVQQENKLLPDYRLRSVPFDSVKLIRNCGKVIMLFLDSGGYVAIYFPQTSQPPSQRPMSSLANGGIHQRGHRRVMSQQVCHAMSFDPEAFLSNPKFVLIDSGTMRNHIKRIKSCHDYDMMLKVALLLKRPFPVYLFSKYFLNRMSRCELDTGLDHLADWMAADAIMHFEQDIESMRSVFRKYYVWSVKQNPGLAGDYGDLFLYGDVLKTIAEYPTSYVVNYFEWLVEKNKICVDGENEKISLL